MQKDTRPPMAACELCQARAERREKRLWIAIIVAVLLGFASNMAWIAYESQFDTFSYEQDGSGINNFMTSIIGGVKNGAEGQD